jgi:hypothetical protein
LDEKVFLGKWLRVRVLTSTHGRYNERVGYVSKKLVNVEENSVYTETVSEEINPTVETSMDASQSEDATPTEDATATEDTSTGLEDLGLNSAPADSAETTTADTSTGMTDDSAGLSDLLGGLLK